MRRLSLVRAVLAVHAACAEADLVFALVGSSRVLALLGTGWAPGCSPRT